MITVFVGYDPKEAIAYHTCVNSIIRLASQPVAIVPLALNLLPGYTETHTDASNTFVYSRFLVPYLMNYQGQAIYLDGDMILRDDIAELWNLLDSNKSVQVVKHNYLTRTNVKYLGNPNENFPRKNWSSVILWNCNDPVHQMLTPEFVAQQPGSYLHRFSWLADDRIGKLPIEWNWLPDEFGSNPAAKLLHYTLGTPCFQEQAVGAHTAEWHQERILTEYCAQTDK
jgi:lipopolysaccharide biosynthesis glycosyltransferase